MATTTIGAQLREARERRNLRLGDICRTTKVSIATLDAIERNDLARLSASVFGRGFVRAFAVQVGLDPTQAVADYVAQFPTIPSAEESARPVRGASGDWQKLVFLVTVVAVAFAIGIYSAARRTPNTAAIPAVASPRRPIALTTKPVEPAVSTTEPSVVPERRDDTPPEIVAPRAAQPTPAPKARRPSTPAPAVLTSDPVTEQPSVVPATDAPVAAPAIDPSSVGAEPPPPEVATPKIAPVDPPPQL